MTRYIMESTLNGEHQPLRGVDEEFVARYLAPDTLAWFRSLGGTETVRKFRDGTIVVSSVSPTDDTGKSEKRVAIFTPLNELPVPDYDCETYMLALSDCKHYGTPGPDCAGPRVGVTREGVILCERHYNQ